MKKIIILLSLLTINQPLWAYNKDQFQQQKQPLCFKENKGQVMDQYYHTRTDIQYKLDGPGMTVFIGAGALHYQFYRTLKGDSLVLPEDVKLPPHTKLPATDKVVIDRVDVSLVGANQQAVVETDGQASGLERYYTNPQFTDGVIVHAYQKITYKNIYPGIDWVLYVQGSTLKYDFVVHAGADVNAIRLSYSGADALNLKQNGNLLIKAPFGTITEDAPQTFDMESNQPIPSHFMLDGNQLAFSVNSMVGNSYVIDPGVVWATYYGSGTENAAYPNNLSTDHSGKIYIAGNTSSQHNIATSGSFLDTLPSTAGAFLAKFDSLGNRIWATYYAGIPHVGGSNWMIVAGIAIGRADKVYMDGVTTDSAGIATSGSFQDTLNTHISFFPLNFYLVQFDTNGIRHWGTYYGGNSFPEIGIYGVTSDDQGDAFIYGNTKSTAGIATSGSYQDTLGPVGSTASAFLVKFDSSGNRKWGTYYGDGHEFGIQGAVCDHNGTIYILGAHNYSTITNDAIYATSGTFLTTSAGTDNHYVAAFTGDGTRIWGTFLRTTDTVTSGSAGGPEIDGGAITCDDYHHLYVTAYTEPNHGISTLDSLPSGLFSTFQWGEANFLVQFNCETGQRNWSTYCGLQSHGHLGSAPTVACDANGMVYVAGNTAFPNNIIPNAISTPYTHQDTLIPGSYNYYNDFVMQLDSTGTRHWGTYYGGGYSSSSGGEKVSGLACDANGNVYLLGQTASSSYIATPGSFQDTLGTIDTAGTGAGEADNLFLVRFAPQDVHLKMPVDTLCNDGGVTFNVLLQNQGRIKDDSIKVTGVITDGSGTTYTLNATYTHSLTPGDTASLKLGSLLLANGSYTFSGYIHHITDDSSFTNDSLTTAVYVKTCPNGVNQINLEQQISVYPNPASQSLSVRIPDNMQVQHMRIINSLGMTIYNEANPPSGMSTIDISRYPAGYYLLLINTEQGAYNKSFEVIH